MEVSAEYLNCVDAVVAASDVDCDGRAHHHAHLLPSSLHPSYRRL